MVWKGKWCRYSCLEAAFAEQAPALGEDVMFVGVVDTGDSDLGAKTFLPPSSLGDENARKTFNSVSANNNQR